MHCACTHAGPDALLAVMAASSPTMWDASNDLVHGNPLRAQLGSVFKTSTASGYVARNCYSPDALKSRPGTVTNNVPCEYCS